MNSWALSRDVFKLDFGHVRKAHAGFNLDNDMTCIPPSLSFLAIYNPTLRPSEPFEDDEDAEEQAHILFFTSKDRAVSRDRMLRQVGLGKALVNFAE